MLKTVALTLSITAAAALLATPALSQNGGRKLQTALTGAAEVPAPGDPDGSGTATVKTNADAISAKSHLVAPNQVCTLSLDVLTRPASQRLDHAGEESYSQGKLTRSQVAGHTATRETSDPLVYTHG